MIELRKRYPNGGQSIKRVSVEPWSEGQLLVKVTGSEVSTLHSSRTEADAEAQARAAALERKGWIRKGGLMLTSFLAVCGLALALFCVAVWIDPRAARHIAALLEARAAAVLAAREAYHTAWHKTRFPAVQQQERV